MDRVASKGNGIDATSSRSNRLFTDNPNLNHNDKLHSVGNTVDIKNTRWNNTVGASEVGTVWTGPNFYSGHRTSY